MDARGVDRVHGHVATNPAVAAAIQNISELSGRIHSDCLRINCSCRYGEAQRVRATPAGCRIEDCDHCRAGCGDVTRRNLSSDESVNAAIAVVGRSLPFQRTTEPATKFDPTTVNRLSAPSINCSAAGAQYGSRELIVGAGLLSDPLDT